MADLETTFPARPEGKAGDGGLTVSVLCAGAGGPRGRRAFCVARPGLARFQFWKAWTQAIQGSDSAPLLPASSPAFPAGFPGEGCAGAGCRKPGTNGQLCQAPRFGTPILA